MMYLVRALRAELIKLNRTLAFVLVVLAPLSVNGLMWLGILRNQSVVTDAWKIVANNVLFFWSIMMMPLFIALESALLTGLDFKANSWKHFFALPVPRWSIYMAKQLVLLGLIAASNMILIVGLWLIGSGTQMLHLRPNIDFSALFPFVALVEAASISFLAGLLIITIHTLIAMRWSSMAISIGLGMVMVVAAAFGANNQDWAFLFPWSLPIVATRTFLMDGHLAIPTLLYSVVGAVIVASIGCWYITHRDIVGG